MKLKLRSYIILTNFSGSSLSDTPGASSSALRAAATSTGFSNSATIDSEWARDVGIRTAVQLLKQ